MTSPSQPQPQPQPQPSSGDAFEPRKLTDPRALRALAHPLRVALLEQVALRGPITASAVSALVGTTPANASYHLRMLARYGYVEEADRRRTGRERPWRAAFVGMRVDDDDPDPAVARAARALSDVLNGRWLERLEQFRSQRDQYPSAIRELTDSSQYVLIGTPAEIAAAQNEIAAVLQRFVHRVADHDARPEGSVVIETLLFSHPVDPPAAFSADRTGTAAEGGSA